MKKIKQKLRSSGGLTLVEMLCGVVILILLGLLLNTGLSMAVKSYMDVTAESETQLLLSTVADALSDKLRYSTVTKDADGTLKPGSVTVTITGESSLVAKKGQVLVNDKRLLPDGAYGRGKYIVESSIGTGELITYDSTTNCFILNLKVREASGDISASTTLSVRCLNPPPADKTPEEGEGTT